MNMETPVVQIKDAEQEKPIRPLNGMIMLIVNILLMAVSLLAGLACFSGIVPGPGEKAGLERAL